jgi:GTP-sensing pleiotropic transcriptional regulator CodY
MSELERIIEAIRAMPDEGDGMTVGKIADRVGTDTGMVVAALESIVERDERDERDEATS